MFDLDLLTIRIHLQAAGDLVHFNAYLNLAQLAKLLVRDELLLTQVQCPLAVCGTRLR